MKYSNVDGIGLGQFNEIMNELGYDGNGVYHMADFEEVFTLGPYRAIQAAFFGERFGYIRDSFNPYDEFFTFSGYDNLVSIQECYLQEYIDIFKDEILEYVNENDIYLVGVEEDDEDEYLYTSECGYLGELFEKKP